MNKKILIAYYSRAGKNYVSGSIVDLAVGNAKTIAQKISSLLPNADLFEIEPCVGYPKNYSECTRVAKKELKENARPALTRPPERLNEYHMILLVYPNWWSTMPMCVWSFLEEQTCNPNVIAPICTHEGSGMGKSEQDIKELCPNVNVERGLAIVGSQAAHCDDVLEPWITALSQRLESYE